MKRNQLERLLPFCLFVSFGLGAALGGYFSLFWLFFITALISLILTLYFYKKQRFFLSDVFILSLFFFAGAMGEISSRYGKFDNFLNRENHFTIKAASLPQENFLNNTFWADIREISSTSSSGRVKVRDYTREMQYLHSYGVKGKLRKLRYNDSDFYILWIKKDVFLEELPMRKWDVFLEKTTNYLLTVFKDNLSGQCYCFLSSVFLGRRELLHREENDIFRDVGATHLLAISGSNISLAAMILFFILRLVNVKFRLCLLISLIFLYVYTFLTGIASATVRAVIMYSVFACSFFFKRRVEPLNSLGLAGLISLVINPWSVFDVGFQLSYLSVFAIIMGMKFFPPRPSNSAAVNYLKLIFLSSLSVALFITPIVSFYFGRVYILGILYNIILIPSFTVILMINFLLVIFSPFKFITQSLGIVLTHLVYYFIEICRFLGGIKISYASYKFSLSGVFVYYFLLAGLFIIFVQMRKGRKCPAEFL